MASTSREESRGEFLREQSRLGEGAEGPGQRAMQAVDGGGRAAAVLEENRSSAS